MPPNPYRAAYVVNPHAAGGRTGRHFNRLLPEIREVTPRFVVLETKAPGDAKRLVAQALSDGYNRIVSVGGDGTHFEVLNGLVHDDRLVSDEASMAIVPLGTGSDLAKTLDIPAGPGALKYVAAHSIVRIDIGRVTDASDTPRFDPFYFLSSAHIGVGAVVSRYVNGSAKLLGGYITFLGATVAALFTYENLPLRFTVDGEAFSGKYKELVVANGLYDAGGMKPAPRARINSGQFEVYAIGDLTVAGAVANLPRIYRGTLEAHPQVEARTAKTVTVSCEQEAQVATDGELAAPLPITIDILPAILPIVTGPKAAIA